VSRAARARATDFDEVLAPVKRMVAGSLDEGRRRCLALAADVAATAAAVRGVAAKSALAAGVARDISGGVRLLDGRKTRVERAIAAGDDVIKLRSCVAGVDDALQTDDLEAATKCVGVFREIESAAEAGGTTYELELAAMRHSAARVTEVVTERYFEATAARDDDSVVRWLTLLPLLGLVDAAVVDAYVEYWRCLLRDTVRGVIDAAIAEHATSLATLQRLINAIAAVAKAKLSASAAALQREQGGARLLVLANEAYEAAALAVLARFVAERRVTALAADARRDAQWPRAGNLGLDELDALLEDVATALQRLETWERFAWHSAASIGAPDLFRAAPTRLAEAAAELGGWYATLETRLLEKALDKAEQLDTTRDVACEVHAALKPNKAAKGAPAAALDDVATSSAADDAFYAARRCAVRALAAGYGGAAASVLVAANEMLTSHTLHGLSNRVHQALAAASAAGDFALCEDGDALDALGSTLARGAEDLASLSEDLAARSQELFGGRVNEPVRPKPQSVYAAPNAEEFRLHLVEAQVALNTLELACEAHLGRLREELAVELEESYPQAHSKLRQLEALVSELEPPRGGVAERFASALAAARDAFASALQKPLGRARARPRRAPRSSSSSSSRNCSRPA